MKDVTLVVTSCNRHDLLERTLRSLLAHADFPATVVVEDSPLEPPAWLWQMEGLGAITWVTNQRRKGQIYSIDRAYAEVKTPFIFHCEDDWQFTSGGFLEESRELLDACPKLWTVSLRGDKCNGHPLAKEEGFPVPVHQPYWREGWGGCHFNPGLRRLKDWQEIGGYGRHAGYDPQGNLEGELRLSKLYLDQGFRIGVLPECVVHTGHTRSRAAEKTHKAPKVLVAIPACHKYAYGKFEDKRIGHNTGESYERVRAVRETWAKYVPAFSNVSLRFFYGAGNSHELFNDEVALEVPDDYAHLPHKTKAIYQWALGKGFDYVFKCDDDTFVYVDRLLASGFEALDYVGYCYPANGNYISGGPGYWLSRRALEVLATAPVGDNWAEDKWTGDTLKKAKIFPARDARYLPGFGGHYVRLEILPREHGYVSFHACRPAMMRTLYEANPSPSFELVREALNENYNGAGRTFPLNIRPQESMWKGPEPRVVKVSYPEGKVTSVPTNGGPLDPRRSPQSVMRNDAVVAAAAPVPLSAAEQRRRGLRVH